MSDITNNLESGGNRTIFREWARLTRLVEKIPPKFHQGFTSKEIILTCIASSRHSIVIGSNSGVIFWFDRSSETIKRTNIDDNFISTTALTITHGQYGEALACGNSEGIVAIFLSSQLESAPVCVMRDKHKNAITSIAWDNSGGYLLSGDDQGLVLLSKFHNNSLQAIKLITNDNTAIVQLKFHPLHRNTNILISSLQRTLIAKMDNQGKITLSQVGRKDRKSLAPFGADFSHFENETLIYSSRPGLRLWLSDSDQGAVQQTLIFKDVTSNRSKLILLSFCEEYSKSEPQFGAVYSLGNGLVVTYSSTSFFILDTGLNGSSGSLSVLNYCRFGNKNLRNLAVCHNEIFLLIDSRTVVRVSDRPDPFQHSSPHLERPIISTWKNKFPVEISKTVKPTLQSTLSKLAPKISDADGNATKSGTIQSHMIGQFGLESLSNALAPIFGSNRSSFRRKTLNSTTPLSQSQSAEELSTSCDPPSFSTDFPAHTAVVAELAHVTRSTSVPDDRPFQSGVCVGKDTLNVEETNLEPVTDDIKPEEGITSHVVEEAALEENGHSASPEKSVTSGNSKIAEEGIIEEELVYASYIGKNKKVKLPRKSTNSTSTPALSSKMNGINEKDSWLTDVNAIDDSPIPPSSDTSEFLQELERKDQLLAQILQLDDVAEKKSLSETPTEESSHVDICQSVTQSYSCSPSNSSHLESNLSMYVEEEPNELHEDIYTKYANADEGYVNGLESTEHITPIISQSETKFRQFSPSKDVASVSMTDSKWLSCSLPGTQRVTHMAACRSYIVVVDGQKSVYYQLIDSSCHQSGVWIHVDVVAHQMCVSYCGRHLWRLYKGTVYQGLGVSLMCPSARSWDVVASNIASIGLVRLDSHYETKFYAWLLHNNGTTISIHIADSPKKATCIQTPGCVITMSCNDSRVLVVLDNGKLYRRLNIHHETPNGLDWQWIMTPDYVISAGLSPNNQIWTWTRMDGLFYLDDPSNTWFQVIVQQQPHLKTDIWYNVTSLFKRQVAEIWLVTGISRLCLAFTNSSALLTSDCLKGYSWSKVETTVSNSLRVFESSSSWLQLYCNAVYHDVGVFWLIDRKFQVQCYYDGRLEKISSPTDNKVVGLAVAPQYLWLLTNFGEIFIRAGQVNPVGTGWVELSTLQFGPKNRLCHVSLGSGSAWACDIHGQVYFRLGDNGPPTLLTPAWSLVDDSRVRFHRIYASASNLMVWALDAEHNVYFREGVRSDFLIGLAWVKVPFTKATQLAISEHSVWALSHSGNVYRRCGITRSNEGGDSWESIPGFFEWITVSIDDVLWAINSEGVVFKLSTTMPDMDPPCLKQNADDFLTSEDDWVLL